MRYETHEQAQLKQSTAIIEIVSWLISNLSDKDKIAGVQHVIQELYDSQAKHNKQRYRNI